MYPTVKGANVYIHPYEDFTREIEVYMPAWGRSDKGIILEIPASVGYELSDDEALILGETLKRVGEKVKKKPALKILNEVVEVQTGVRVRGLTDEVILEVGVFSYHLRAKDAIETGSRLLLRGKQLKAGSGKRRKCK